MSDSATPSSTAIHEAAHTVLALYCRLQVDRVTIVRDGSVTGKCWFRPFGAPPIITAAVYLAGFLAVKIADHYAPSWPANSDLTEAAKLLPAKADLNDFMPKVERRLYLLWNEIVGVAEALDRDKELVGVDHIRSVARLTSWLG
jgi:hypothetical protein